MFKSLLNILWVNKVTNKNVLQKLQKEKELFSVVNLHKLQYFGHTLRAQNTPCAAIMQEEIKWKKWNIRKKISWFRGSRHWTKFGIKISVRLVRVGRPTRK